MPATPVLISCACAVVVLLVTYSSGCGTYTSMDKDITMKPPTCKRLKFSSEHVPCTSRDESDNFWSEPLPSTSCDEINNFLSEPLPSTSLDGSDNDVRSTNDQVFRACSSCHIDFPRDFLLILDANEYNLENLNIRETLSYPVVDSFGDCYICVECDNTLRDENPIIPVNSVARKIANLGLVSPDNAPGVERESYNCIVCQNSDGSRLKHFNIELYNGDSAIVKRLILEGVARNPEAHICVKCHRALCRQNIVVCILCEKRVKKVCAAICKSPPGHLSLDVNADKKAWMCKECHSEFSPKFKCYCCDLLLARNNVSAINIAKYDMSDDLVATTLAGADGMDYICRRCDRNMLSSLVCTCCHGKCSKYRVTEFLAQNYDFEDYIVSRALSDGVRVCVGDTEYICYTCKGRLQADKTDFPTMPRNAYARKLVDPGSRFLRAIREKPEFVCTCCHRMLFQRSVIRFDANRYNMVNEIVAETLATKYRHPMKVHIYKGVRNAHIHAYDYDEVIDCDSDSEDADDNNSGNSERSSASVNVRVEMFEYMCKTCDSYLRKCIPKMPPQACANGLLLPPVPPELSGLTDLERRIISLRIPFMSIFCAVRYGSSYKVRGGCTNVPASLDQVVEMLPRMSTDVQYHQMRLKKKMSYKSSYMDHYVRKDKVMVAIKWLTENNPLYANIKLNAHWATEWENGEFSMFMRDSISELPAPDGGDDSDLDDDGVPDLDVSDALGDVQEMSSSEKADKELEIKELSEDRAAMERSIRTVGCPMSNCLQAEDMENEIYTCSPGENKTPLYMLMDDNFEVLAFPDLFPWGVGGYSCENRPTKLTMRKYFQQRLTNVDGRFAKNIEYLFCAQYVTDIKHIQGETSLALRTKRGKTFDGQAVTAGMLRNPVILNRLVRNEQAYKFLRNVRGSPAYWQHELYELLAMLRTFGIPTWFVTLSAADLHWVEMIESVTVRGEKPLTLDQVRKMPIKERAEQLKNNPVTGVTMFQYRVERFFADYLYQDFNPVGDVREHAIKIEFQERGSPHAHCLLWVDGAPRVDVDSDEDVCAFVDKYVSGCIPNENKPSDKRIAKMVKRFETHKHSAYCRRKHSCRFGFPKAPSPRTIICREPDDDEESEKDETLQNSCEILSKVHDVIDAMSAEPQPLSSVLDAVGVTEDEYVRALSICRKGRNIILKRDPADCFTNGCNHEILRLWNANIDFQYVFDEVTCIIYISSYMMKGERALGEVLKNVARECMSDPVEEKLKKIGKAFIGKRVVGAPEAAMRELSMWVMRKSRKVVFVNANTRDNRDSVPKSEEVLKGLEDDEENIYMTSVHDRYAARPDQLEGMCLAKFAVAFDYASGPGRQRPQCNAAMDGNVAEGVGNEHEDDDVHNIDEGFDMSGDEGNGDNDDGVPYADTVITLKHGLGFMRRRRKDAVLRVTSFKQVVEPEKYYHSRLILYVPWRSEDEFLDGFSTYKEKYITVSDVAEDNARNFNTHQDDLDNAINEIAENGLPELNWDAVAPMAEEENTIAENADRVVVRMLDSDDEESEDKVVHDLDLCPVQGNRDTNDNQPKNNLTTLYEREARKDIMSNAEYRMCMRGLNAGQKKIVMFNRKWCKERILAMQNGKKHGGFKVCLNGPGGTGKSHVIKMIRRDVIYLLQRSMKIEPGHPLVLLTAPTGLAAFNIDGITLHSAFMLSTSNAPVDKSYAKKSTMQIRLGQLGLCVIDEISMVGRDNFESVARKIAQIKQSNTDWADVSILAVGDFYQLPPVCQCPVYARKRTIRKPGDMAPSLWDDFMLHELTEVMRTKDINFAQILNSIREVQPAKGSYADYVLLSRELKITPNHPDYPIDLMHVYAQNDACAEWNNLRINCLPGELTVSRSVDVAKDRRTNLSGIIFPDKPKMTGNLVKELYLKIGARVMLTTNVNVSDGLTNGAMGTVTELVGTENRGITVVLVRFDSDRIGQETIMGSKYRAVHPTSVPIYRAEAMFTLNTISVRVSRSQFPLQLCWGVTIHKCQGMTLPGIVVDMTPSKGTYRGGQAYVALSRVRSLDTLHIINYERKQIRVATNVMGAMTEMRTKCLPDIPGPLTLRADVNDHLIIVHLNVANIKAKLLDVQNDDIFKCAHIICFNETHLSSDDVLTNEMLGIEDTFEIFRCDRVGKGGGVLMAVHKDLSPMRVLVQTDIEYVVTQIRYNGLICYIMAIYRPPTYSVNQWNKYVGMLLESYVQVKICIVGDVNDDVLGNAPTPVVQMFDANGYVQHISKPTRDSGSAIDHVYTRNISIENVLCDVSDCYYSDHDIVTTTLDLKVV